MSARKSDRCIWWLLLSLLFFSTPLIGTIGAVSILFLSMLTSGVAFNRGAFLELKKQPMIVMFSIGYLVFAFFTAITSRSPSDLLVIFYFSPFLLCAVAFLYARKYASKKTAIIILSMCLIGSGLTIVVALIDIYFLNAVRPRGFFSGVITLAMVGTTLGIVSGMGLFLVDGYKKAIFILGPIFAILAITLTQSRGTAIALPALTLLYFIYAIRRTKTVKTKVITIGALLSFSFLALFLVAQGSTRIADLTNIIGQVMSGDIASLKASNIRIEMFQAGWELFLASPIFGYGWNNMGEMAFTILDITKYDAQLIRFFQFHNDFLNYAFAIGIIGIIVYFTFLFAPLVGALKTPRDSMFALRVEIILLMLTLYAISGLTAEALSHGLLITVYAFISAVVLGAFRDDANKTDVQN
ncbi:MAG: O-antigen ligase family protein [Devosiaceae bacterium]|nr:O-antigen ligase family protein [Devosiaceae bacterium]